MSSPYIAEIRIFAGNFAPRGWAFCNGQLLQIATNTALFSIVGTIYGGDGRTTFGLPNLQGRIPMGTGQGPGLSFRQIGQKGGVETVTLNQNTMASHNHSAMGSTNIANQRGPVNFVVGTGGGRGVSFYQTDTSSGTGRFRQLDNNGGGGAHNNDQPYLALNYIIALVGVYPPRS